MFGASGYGAFGVWGFWVSGVMVEEVRLNIGSGFKGLGVSWLGSVGCGCCWVRGIQNTELGGEGVRFRVAIAD